MNRGKQVCHLISFLGLLVFGAMLAQTAGAVEFYVAPGGSDLAKGSKEQPLATIERARDLVREMKKTYGTEVPVRVVLRDGIYFLKETLTLTAEDSGVVYTALAGEHPVISGGQAVRNWQTGAINGKACWVADLGSQGERSFRELFIDGKGDPSRPRTRVPEKGFYRFSKENPLGKGEAWRIQPESLKFNPGEMKAWDNIGDIELVFLQRWLDCHNRVSRVDEASHTVHFAPKAAKGISDSNNMPAQYCVYNVKEALDAPGEWYFDRPTGKLYYLPLPGEAMDKTTAIAPRLKTLIRIQGTPVRKVEGGRFEHISFRHAETDVLDGGRQGASNIPGGVILENVFGFDFFDCQFTQMGCYAAEVAAGSVSNRFVACRFENLGGGGVRVDEGSQHTTVADCIIHQGGRIWLTSDGVFIQNSPRNRVVHNHIYDFYYSAVACGWTWGYAPTQCFDNLFENNLIHDLGYGLLDDMGGFYTLGAQAGTVIRGNVIHDVSSYHYGGWGIYTDEGSSGILIENNLVYRANNGGFHQHYGRDNILRNNIFAMAGIVELKRTRYEHINSFVFEKNIVYLDPKAKLLEGAWEDGNYTMRDNLFWRHGGGKVDFNGKSLEEWQRQGKDSGSALGDPLFKNVAADDFTLQPGSSALKRGFKPIDAAQAGPRKLDPRQVDLGQWPLPEEKPRVIMEGRLVGMEIPKGAKNPAVKGYGQPLVLTAGKPLAVSFSLLNRGMLASRGEVEFKIVPAGAATIEGEKRLSYDLKPGEKATVKLTVKTERTDVAPVCCLVTVPRGEGLVPSALCINAPDKRPSQAKKK
jgi:parallel beta-helix repeat protein